MTCAGCRMILPEATRFCPACGKATAFPAASVDSLRARVQAALEAEYSVVRLLGRGGMGAVYLAREIALDRLVAIKVLPPDASEDESRRARFRREAQLAAKLSHPNIVPLHSFRENGGLLSYVMGFVRGESLADRLRREERIPAEEARLYLAQLADALEYAHARGVIHRDLKPDNILLDDETGRPLLADFGIARAAGGGATTQDGGIVGTIHYMSPEQASGTGSIDGRTDLYSLGVVGYAMLSGQTPFDAATFSAFAAQQANTDPPLLHERAAEVPPDLSSAIMRCLSRDASQRWPDARAFRDALGASIEEEERLPGELRELAGALFWAVVGAWVIPTLVLIALPARILLWPLLLPAAVSVASVYVFTAAIHRRKGFTWAEMGRVARWPPSWWPFWWPPPWRRPHDLWNRLPRVVRVVRTWYGAVLALFALGLPLAATAGTRRIFFLLLGTLWIAVTFTMLFVAWWAHRRGIPNNADLRSLFMRSTMDRRFWKRPSMAARLEKPAARPSGSFTSPATPADCLREIIEGTRHMTGSARQTGVQAAEVGRLVCAEIDRLDSDIAAQKTDSAVRDRLAGALCGLWTEHAHLLRDNTPAALDRVNAAVVLLERELQDRGTRDAPEDPEAVTFLQN